MQCTERSRSGHRASGFSLVEVLISIIVLSFGMLGMVGMQAAALQANREARLQSVAYQMAQELAEMMRGNKDVGLLPATSSNPYLGDFKASPLAPASPSYCLNVDSANGCTTGITLADQIGVANAQMTEWLTRVDHELPGARVVVCIDSAPYDGDGLPQWQCTAASGTTALPPTIKIGWTQGSTNRAATGANAMVRARGDDAASRPGLVFPVLAGSSQQ